MASWRSFRNRLHKLFEYQTPRKATPVKRTTRSIAATPSPMSPTYDQYSKLWKMEELTEEERRYTQSDTARKLYDIAWRDKRISYHQRKNARSLLADEFARHGMIFSDVFDYDQWQADMGYAELTR